MHRNLALPALYALLLSSLALAAQAQSGAAAEAAADRSVAPVQVSVAEVPAAHANADAVAATPATLPEPSNATQVKTQAEPFTPPFATHRIAIGNATEKLFAMQRDLPAQRPRHIDGEQASRSYQRYLKSFETSIPEKYDTGLDVKQ